MHRIKDMSRGGWIVIGILIALLLVPSGVAVAAALKYTGLEGTSGNKADVTPAGQLMTTEASAANSFNLFGLSNVTETVVPPGTQAAIVTNIHADVYDVAPAGGLPLLLFDLYSGSCTSGTLISNVDEILPSAAGMNVLPFTPGLVVAAGDSLCMFPVSLSAAVSANGYHVAAAAG
jgi:hypothetical protein